MREVSPSIQHEATHRSEVPDPLPPPKRIGLIVEGDKDKLLVEALAHKVLARLDPASAPSLATVRLAGSPRVEGTLQAVKLLKSRGYQTILVLFNTKTRRRSRVRARVRKLRLPLLLAGVSRRVTLVPVTPCIEGWVLADAEALEKVTGRRVLFSAPRGARSARQMLEELLGGWGLEQQQRVAEYLDPERIRAREPSFDRFARTLERALESRPPMEARKAAVQREYESLKLLGPERAQERGRLLERVISDLLALEMLQPARGWRTTGEEIDLYLTDGYRHFLGEVKWAQELAASDVYAFRGKLESKLVGTLGLFFFLGGRFSRSALQAITSGKQLNTLLFDEQDLDLAMSPEHSFKHILEVKLQRAATHGDIYYTYQTYLNQHQEL